MPRQPGSQETRRGRGSEKSTAKTRRREESRNSGAAFSPRRREEREEKRFQKLRVLRVLVVKACEDLGDRRIKGSGRRRRGCGFLSSEAEPHSPLPEQRSRSRYEWGSLPPAGGSRGRPGACCWPRCAASFRDRWRSTQETEWGSCKCRQGLSLLPCAIPAALREPEVPQ